MDDEAFLVLLSRNLPDLLDADTVMLRVLTGIQGEFVDQLLAQVATAALGK